MNKYKLVFEQNNYGEGRVQMVVEANDVDSVHILGEALAGQMEPTEVMVDRGNPCGSEPVLAGWFCDVQFIEVS